MFCLAACRKLEKKRRAAARDRLEEIEAEKQKLLASGLITEEQAAALDQDMAEAGEGEAGPEQGPAAPPATA